MLPKNPDLRYLIMNGVIYFSSPDAYFHLTDSLAKLTTKDRYLWEKKNNFISFRTMQDSIIKLIENASNENEFSKLLSKYSRYVVFQDSTVCYLDYHPFKVLVSNAEGIFCVGQVYHKIENNKILFTESDNYQKALANFSDKVNVAVLDVPREMENRKLKSWYDTCGHIEYAESTVSDRKIKFWLQTDVDGIRFNSCDYRFTAYYKIKIETLKFKKIERYWSHYTTLISYENIAFNVEEKI